MHNVLELNNSKWLKPYVEFNTQKRTEAENDDKNGKPLYKLMNNAVLGKDIKQLRKRISVRLSRNKKDYLEWTLKLNSKPQKISYNSLVTIRKS